MSPLTIGDDAARYAALLQSLPIVSYIARPDGTIVFVSAAWSQLIGLPSDVLGGAFPQIIHPDDAERAIRNWNEARASGGLYRDEMRLRFGDGSYRWILSQASPLRAPDAETIRAWIGTVADIHESKLNEARLRESAAFTDRLLSSSEDCIKVLELDGRLLSINPAGMQLLHIRRLEDVRGSLWPSWWTGRYARLAEDAVATAAAGSSGRFVGMTMVDDEERWFDVLLTPIAGDDGRPERLLVISRDVTEGRRADEARKRIAEGLSLLARAGAATVLSLDYRSTLESIAQACIDGFSSYCIIDVFDADGGWERIAAHRNPALRAALESLSRPVGQHPIARTARTGFSGVVPVDEKWLTDIDATDERKAVVRMLGVRLVLVAPVVTPNGTRIGALTLGIDREITRDYRSSDDLPFVEEVGRRAGAAIANARLFERNRRIAVELQAASLPLELPRIEHVQIDAYYGPGSDEATIGGDWYDAFALDDGRVVITVGDVIGHGLRAAVVMTKLRQAMQSAAMVDPDPTVMLKVADRTIRLLAADTYATSLAAIYDRATGRLSFASAGHPAPVVRFADGGIMECTGSGIMLGVGGCDPYALYSVPVAPGSTMVFFTDGLVEATHDFDAGQARLRAVLASEQIVRSSNPARAIVERVLGGVEARDDIAVLVVRVAAA